MSCPPLMAGIVDGSPCPPHMLWVGGWVIAKWKLYLLSRLSTPVMGIWGNCCTVLHTCCAPLCSEPHTRVLAFPHASLCFLLSVLMFLFQFWIVVILLNVVTRCFCFPTACQSCESLSMPLLLLQKKHCWLWWSSRLTQTNAFHCF